MGRYRLTSTLVLINLKRASVSQSLTTIQSHFILLAVAVFTINTHYSLSGKDLNTTQCAIYDTFVHNAFIFTIRQH